MGSRVADISVMCLHAAHGAVKQTILKHRLSKERGAELLLPQACHAGHDNAADKHSVTWLDMLPKPLIFITTPPCAQSRSR